MSPVDSAITKNADGSASIWVANVDRAYGMQWRVELRLRPGTALLEQHVALYNPSPVRRRFYWWNNAAVRVRDTSRIFYPMRWTASHGFTESGHLAGEPGWPRPPVVASAATGWAPSPSSATAVASLHGRLPSLVRGRRRPLLVAEDAPPRRSGRSAATPTGIDWRRALPTTHERLRRGAGRPLPQPGDLRLRAAETIRFTEYWMPVRAIGGSRARTPRASSIGP
jgi:hypothetical protein